jgi:hypothetical protein
MCEEIGKAFWKNVYVDLNAWQFLIIDLLNDRPAVHEGIKGIQIGIDCDSDPSALNHLVDFCNCISEELILDEFRLVFYTNPRVAREILDTGNDLKWVKAFRQIKVEKIKVELLLVAFEYESLAHPNAAADEDGDDGTHVTERIQRLAKKLGAEMEVFLRPALPRVLADEDYYRETRTELLGEDAAAYR